MAPLSEKQQDRNWIINRDQIVTLGDLEEFKKNLLSEVGILLKQVSYNEPRKKWLKANELCDVLRISKGKLQYLRDTGVIPYTKIGGITYYDYEKIILYMEAGKFET